MKQGIEVWIVIPEPLMQNKTFYLVSVKDLEDGRRKMITVREPECWEAEVTVQVRRKT